MSRWRLPKDRGELLLARLTDFGLLGSTEDLDLDAVREGAKEVTTLTAYFNDPGSLADLQRRLAACQHDGIQLLAVDRIPQGDWATAWKEYFKPFSLTPEIVICPSWETYAPRPGETVVILDPGMAFGTGLHDTTRFCAEALCELRRKFPRATSVLDVGCGSGILAIIAARLGFDGVVGIDNDAVAVATARENWLRNMTTAHSGDARHTPRVPKNRTLRNVKGGTPLFLCTDGSLDGLPRTHFDVIVANIFAETVCELKPELLKHLAASGFLVLSGILREADAAVRVRFANMELMDFKSSPEWHAYVYRRK